MQKSGCRMSQAEGAARKGFQREKEFGLFGDQRKDSVSGTEWLWGTRYVMMRSREVDRN